MINGRCHKSRHNVWLHIQQRTFTMSQCGHHNGSHCRHYGIAVAKRHRWVYSLHIQGNCTFLHFLWLGVRMILRWKTSLPKECLQQYIDRRTTLLWKVVELHTVHCMHCVQDKKKYTKRGTAKEDDLIRRVKYMKNSNVIQCRTFAVLLFTCTSLFENQNDHLNSQLMTRWDRICILVGQSYKIFPMNSKVDCLS